jgi:hypothetical protein
MANREKITYSSSRNLRHGCIVAEAKTSCAAMSPFVPQPYVPLLRGVRVTGKVLGGFVYDTYITLYRLIHQTPSEDSLSSACALSAIG